MTKINLILMAFKPSYSIEDFWKEKIDDAFDELDGIIQELDLSDKSIQKLLGILQKDKKVLLDNLTCNVIEEKWEML